ncbi:MAG: hypothetical protein K1X52_01490 [Pyrinomonadaceae bacterium]|nr:hypothetical protein [Pyrinomonadaceae bacterium]
MELRADNRATALLDPAAAAGTSLEPGCVSQNRLRQRAVSIAAGPPDSKGVTLNAASGRIATAFMPWDKSLNQDPGGGLPPTMTVFCPSEDARGTALGTNK